MPSPEMQAFMARQVARRAKAEEGVAKADRLMERWKAARKTLAKMGGSLSPGYASNDQMIKRAGASYGLAINRGMSDYREYDKWMADGDREIVEAEKVVQAAEDYVARYGRG